MLRCFSRRRGLANLPVRKHPHPDPLPQAGEGRRAGVAALLARKAIETLVNTCTVGVSFVREIELACAAAGVAVIDVPISGGVARK